MSLLEDLFNLQVPADVQISPNSQHILYSTALAGLAKSGEHSLSTIWLAETGKESSSRQLTSGLSNDRSPRWSPDGTTIAFLSDRAKAGEACAIYLFHTSGGGEPYPITPAENERDIVRFGFSPDGKSIAYVSADEKGEDKKRRDKEKDDAFVWGQEWEYNRLRVVDVSSKKVTTLVDRDAHVIDLAWNNDGTKIAVLETPDPNIESQYIPGTMLFLVDVGSKEAQLLGAFPGRPTDFTYAGDAVFFVGPGTAPNLIAANVPYQCHIGEKTEGPKKLGDYGVTSTVEGLGKAGTDIVVKVQDGLEDSLRFVSGNTIFRSDKKLMAWDATFTSDSDEMIVAIAQGDVTNPTEVFSTTASGGAMIKLSDHGHTLASRDFGSCTPLSCKSKDGKVKLDGLFLTPSAYATGEGTPSKPVPTVVLVHGGPYTRVTNAFDAVDYAWTPALLASGYAVMSPNYRGGSGRGEDFASDARGGVGVNDYDDIISLTQHSIDRGYADKEKLIIGGWSQGGFASYTAAVRNGYHDGGWKFKGTIPGAGVSDFATMCLTSDLGKCFEAELFGRVPWGDESSEAPPSQPNGALREFAAAVKKGNVIPPILMLHGERDERVPLEQARGFRRALMDAKLPFEYVVYPREPHVVKEKNHRLDMMRRVLRFVEQHIGHSNGSLAHR